MEKEQSINMLKDVLKIDSTLGNEKEVADYLEKILKENDIAATQVKYGEGRHQLIAEIGEGSKVLGFTGHMDVVPTGEIAWQHHPFGAEEAGGKIFGRGASDMKSGLVAQVIAMINLKNAGLPIKGKIKLLATVGEETSAIGAEQLVAEKYGDDLDALVIGEPTGLEIGIAHKGALWLKITTSGQTAHGSMPNLGINAVEHMIKFLTAFQNKFDFSLDVDDLVGPSTSSIDVIHGGNGTNVVPDRCTVEIDIRTIAAQNHKNILQEVQDLIVEVGKNLKGFKAEVEVINDLQSVRTEKDDPFVSLAYAAVKKYHPEALEPFGGPGYTDGSRFVKAAKKFPIIIVGPGEGAQAHQPDEYVYTDKYLLSISVYEEIAKAFLV